MFERVGHGVGADLALRLVLRALGAVYDLPAACRDVGIGGHLVRRRIGLVRLVARFEGRRRRDRLEGRSLLEAVAVAHVPVDGQVQLGLVLAEAVRLALAHGEDLAGARLHHGVGGDVLVGLVDVLADALEQRRLRLRVERGPDRETAYVPRLLPVGLGLAEGRVLQERVAHVVAEEAGAVDGGDTSVLRRADLEAERGLLRGGRLRGGDVLELGHARQHRVAAVECRLLVADRVVAARRLHHAGQQRGLGQGEVLRGGAEVALRGGLDAVGLLAEEGDVEVVLQDLLLAQFLLDLDRVLHFLDLAADGLLGGLGDLGGVVARLLDEDVLDVLLGQRRGALGAAVGGVVAERAQDALEVEGAVLVVARVLDVDYRLEDVRAHGRDRDDGAVARVDGGDQAAVGVQDLGRLAERRCLQLARQVVEACRRTLRRQAERTGGGQGDSCQDRTGQNTDAEELGGLLGRREPPARTLVSHGCSLRGDSPDVRPGVRLVCNRQDANVGASLSPVITLVSDERCPNFGICRRTWSLRWVMRSHITP
ncbi:hypothetical protein SCOCK_30065 [Actinacidiphila cocklensis]|uniref:Uncharacterized protein n=1 Tax=Actinacidiphila cocklensis TaxID=887465 RepID=A0A9W4GTN4_9ACTN|nr:hypothetical protein SCOCK_30065 [Actinacidiphila cocklensis]